MIGSRGRSLNAVGGVVRESLPKSSSSLERKGSREYTLLIQSTKHIHPFSSTRYRIVPGETTHAHKTRTINRGEAIEWKQLSSRAEVRLITKINGRVEPPLSEGERVVRRFTGNRYRSKKRPCRNRRQPNGHNQPLCSEGFAAYILYVEYRCPCAVIRC